ncbi:MAG: FtsH protease activity modulator HflK [Treponema sp.]|nr:FtsH protease activity modulator HflK [Treponema sp.]
MSEKSKSFFKKLIRPSGIITIIIIILAISLVASSAFVVDESEQAVITRFGAYNKTLGPGLHIKMPFGIDKKYIVDGNKVVKTEQFGFRTSSSGVTNLYQNGITSESTMLTGDLNIVDVEWIIQYRITDPKAWLFSVDERTNTIRDISRSAINTLVGDRAILEIMGNERTNIENLAVDDMNEQFKKLNMGINVVAVRLQNIVPPAGVQEAFEDVNKAIQDMNRFINEGKESYNSEIPKAQGEADREIQVAEGYASERVNKAKGDVARFNSVYEEYRKAPAVTRERLYLETMEQVFNQQAKDKKPTLIDDSLENILPIKNLAQ